MFTFLKKTARVITHSILSLLAVGIVLLILLQIALVGTFLWLNTGKGRAIIEKELQLIMAETGQDITIGRLFYDPARGLNIYDVTLRDKTGPLITLDRLSARVAFEKITARILDLDIDGGTLTIHRLPPGSSTDSEMQPFAIPDIYFQRINISRLTFNEINVAEAVFGTALSLSPTLRADMTLGDIITLKISLSPQLIMADIPVPPPEAITLSAQLNPQTLALTINEARIKSSAYQLDGKGETMLGNNGALTFTLTGAYDDLRALTGNQLASTNFNATIGGILDTPSLTLQGVLTPATLAENGVEDIKFNITPLLNSPDIAADIIITTTFKDQPVTIKSRALYDAPYLRLSDLNATAPHLDVKGTIALDTNTTLAEGTLSIATDDLSYYNSLTGQDISGALKGTLALTTTDGLQSLSTNFTADNARYTTTTAKQLSGDIAIADIRNPWPHKATITTNRLALSPSMTVDKGTLSITADGAQSYALTLSGNGTMQQPFSFNGNAAISNLTAVFPTIRNAALDLNVQKSTMNVTGDLSPEAINITAKTQNFSLTAIPATIPDALANGLLSGTITMTGTPAAPITKGDITIGNLDTGAYKDLRFTAQLNHENGTATTQINGAGPGLRTFTINAALPLDFSAQPFTFALNDAVALSGAINADIDVAAITPLFLPPTQEATGTLATKATLGGTFKSPAIDGTLSFNDGLFIDRANGVHLADLSASGTFDKDRLTIQKFTGTDGADGRLNGNGTMDFGDNQGTNLKLTLNEFHLPQSEMANGTLNADLTLKDSNDGYNLAGDITVARMDIMIPERFQSNIPTLNIIDPAQQAQEQNNPQKIFDLAITVDAPNQVFVRGWGLDAEFGGKVDISGDAAAPIFDGTLKSRRGRYEEFGKRFTLSRAELRFQGRIPPSPYLDIEATTPADDVTASILLTGPVNDPAISFAAVPALPQDEVLSRILFGRNTSRITPMQAIQLTQTMRRFSGQGGGGFDPLGTLRNVTGLDNIAVDTDESGATNVGVGKYLSDKVYLEFNRGQGEASGAANLQIEVSPQISVETEVGQDARAGGGVFWRRDY